MNTLVKWLFRAPVALFDHRLDRLLGQRFLQVTHVGRRSGRLHRTVLEVIGTIPATGEVVTIAGYGPGANWFRNIQAHPAVEIALGGRRFRPVQRVLDEAAAVAVITAYERRHRIVLPLIKMVLSRLVGWRYDASDAAHHRLAVQLPMVAFGPAPSGREARFPAAPAEQP